MFALKFLTIIIFLIVLNKLFSNNKIIRKETVKVLEKLKEIIIKNECDIETALQDELLAKESMGLIVIVIFMFIGYLIEFAYICFSIKYDPYYYVIAIYLVFWLTMLIKCKIKSKINTMDTKECNKNVTIEHIDKSIKEIEEISSWSRIQSVIDLIFYIYMMYIFFIY
ncbi:hypothetical protein K144316041_p20710 (plasmid) [Clostridium tetani]|uniref:hypothetical protein n=1 Tax=Clostridium tetani TaxID=1513 RepID=UPI002953C148|nr:hypothetical protein [Clostridium tetani]BDR74232.1 hypothetical protein K144316041_p20710 [Clostridium tetani]